MSDIDAVFEMEFKVHAMSVTDMHETRAEKSGDVKEVRVVHKGRPQKRPLFLPPCPQVSAFDQLPSPFGGRPHLASYSTLCSDSVIAGALKIRCSLVSSSEQFTPTPMWPDMWVM